MIALEGCTIVRPPRAEIEIIAARPERRSFPSRITETLGVCLKVGPNHDVRADGRRVVYPSAALCVRAPGCVWGTEDTGPVGFLSIDIGQSLLPRAFVRGSMRFAASGAIPGFTAWVRRLAAVSTPRIPEMVAGLVIALEDAGLFAAEELRERASPKIAARARDALESRIADPPSLAALASELGTNRFSLLRAFKQAFGITPRAFVVGLRVELARARLARGAEILDVAHALGFADQPHFTRAFKRIVGLTPGAYARSGRRVVGV